MAQFTVEIPDEHVATVVGALCGMYGYDSENPQDGLSAPQFANRVVRNFIKEVTTAYAVKLAESALQTARDSVAGIEISDPSIEGTP